MGFLRFDYKFYPARPFLKEFAVHNPFPMESAASIGLSLYFRKYNKHTIILLEYKKEIIQIFPFDLVSYFLYSSFPVLN